MNANINAWLYDILNAVNEIENFIIDVEANFLIFENDIKTQRAIERNIEIVGEAMNRILKEDATIEITNATKIVDVRNRIIHGYDTVSNEIIWGIVIKYLPILRIEVEKLLGE